MCGKTGTELQKKADISLALWIWHSKIRRRLAKNVSLNYLVADVRFQAMKTLAPSTRNARMFSSLVGVHAILFSCAEKGTP
jgi:hypothetical protein